MALDTQAKRASAIGVSSPWRGVVPVPDGTIGQGDRQAIAYYCAAVLFEASVEVTAFTVGWFSPPLIADWTTPPSILDWTSPPELADWSTE